MPPPGSEISGPTDGAGSGGFAAGTRVLPAIIGVAALVAGILLVVAQLDDGSERPVRFIEVEGAHMMTAAETIRLSGLERGLVYDDRALEQAVERLRLHPAVRDARVERTAEGVLRVVLEERECVAAIRAEGAATIFEIDAGLAILSENRPRCRGVPLVQGSFARDEDRDRFDDPVLARIVAGLGLMRRSFPELVTRISELRRNGESGYTLFLATPRVRVEMAPDWDEQSFRRLYAAVAYYEQRGFRGGVIDLRGADALVLGAE